MEFAQKFMVFILLAGMGGLVASRLGGILGGDDGADRFLAAGVVFFALVTVAGAALGFTGNIGQAQYLAFYCIAALAAELTARRLGAGPIKSILPPAPTLRPLPVGFFLS